MKKKPINFLKPKKGNLIGQWLIEEGISAGFPSPADDFKEVRISLDKELINNEESTFYARASGNSMEGAGILDGDIAVLEKTELVNNGDIVVALIDNQEATLKRIRKKSNSIALEPANKNFETRIFGPKRITIQGKLVGIIRNY